MKSGQKIDAEDFKAAGVDADIPYLSRQAYNAMNAKWGEKGAEDYIVERVNGMKHEYGTGASTLVTIYNAIGVNLKLIDQKNPHGSYFKYQPDSDIFNGEWSGLLHIHPGGAAIGSHGLLCYDLVGSTAAYNEDIVLIVAWANHYSGANQAACGYTSRANWRANADRYYDIMTNGASSSGTSEYGVLGASVTIGSETSPICRVVASQVANL